MIEQTILSLAIICLLAGWLGAVLVRRHAVRLGLVTIPNHRSSHSRPTPQGGGLGIVLAGTVAGGWLAWRQGTADELVVAGLALVVAAIGLADDIRHMPARLRFGVQLAVCAGLLWATGDIVLSSTLEWLLAAMLLFAGVWWINLFNFMDGIDGIAGIETVCVLSTAAIFACAMNPSAIGSTSIIWMAALVAATAGFLLLNWPPARIFMGDSGSTYLAFMLFAMVLLTVRDALLTYPAWLILGAAFITDASVTLMRRMMAGEKWFEAHRSHAYQYLARRWGSHRPVTLAVAAINILWLAPLAWTSLVWPSWAWAITITAYAPLVAAVWWVGAGRNDNA